jgi:hypothetical protein
LSISPSLPVLCDTRALIEGVESGEIEMGGIAGSGGLVDQDGQDDQGDKSGRCG